MRLFFYALSAWAELMAVRYLLIKGGAAVTVEETLDELYSVDKETLEVLS
jgi:hypothetical protein